MTASLGKTVTEGNAGDGYFVEVDNLVTQFFTSRGIVKALEGVSLRIRKGEIFGLVGESGCGKSVTANSIMDLIPDPPGRIMDGSISIDGLDIVGDKEKLSSVKMKSETNVKIRRHKRQIKRHNYILSKIRGKKMAMIFQEPFLALNPVIRVGEQIMESIMLHERIGIANSIIRRETLKQGEVSEFVDSTAALPDSEQRKTAINRWSRQMGLEAIEQHLLELFENEKERNRLVEEVTRLASEQQTDVAISALEKALEYYREQEQLFDLNLKLFEIEIRNATEVNRLSAALSKKMEERAAARTGGDSALESKLGGEAESLRVQLGEASSRVDDSQAAELRSQINVLRRGIFRRHLPYIIALRLTRKRKEKPFRLEARRRTLELLELVNIAEPTRVIDSYPHELSGGMQQRVMIAMALASSPRLLIADEPTTALDVTTQAQILDLIRELRNVTDSSVLFITHDLAVIAEMCDRVGVMYAGNLVEEAQTESVFYSPKHPYTQGLLQSIPKIPERSEFQELKSIPGSVPNLITPPAGCRFHPRCGMKMDICSKEKPELLDVGGGHKVACWLYTEKKG